jgi:hypothetical protein
MPHIPTLYQLIYREFTLRYGLFREEIQELIDNPDRRVDIYCLDIPPTGIIC